MHVALKERSVNRMQRFIDKGSESIFLTGSYSVNLKKRGLVKLHTDLKQVVLLFIR